MPVKGAKAGFGFYIRLLRFRSKNPIERFDFITKNI